jgi:hypothetical protein
VTTTDGRTLRGRVDEPKGDPGNTLSRAEIEDKMQRLAQYGGGTTAQEAQALCRRIWQLPRRRASVRGWGTDAARFIRPAPCT